MVACAKNLSRATVKVTREADAPLEVISGVTVVLEDHGQDFLEFDIVGGRIVQTRPFRGDLWNGVRVRNATLTVGDVIWLRLPHGWDTLNYPVATVHPLDRARIGATDV